MASTKIRGITIELSADTTGLDKALKGVNGEIKETQNALKDVNKLLKLDPKNTELLQQKQKLLADTVTETSKKLDTLKKAQENMKSAGVDENSKQYMALQREIASTELYLKDAEKAAKDFGSVSLQKLETSLQNVSDKAAMVQQKTKGLSAAGAAVAGGLIANAVNAGKTADDLNTLAKQYGVTTAEIQKMNYAQDLIDVSTDDMLRSYSKMEKTMASAAKAGDYAGTAFGKLGVEITNSDGSMRKANDVWYDTLEALSKVGNETERDQISMDIFGKSAMELAGVIDDGGAALKKLGDEAEQNGLILSQDALDGANQFNDALDKLKATATQAFLESGAELAESLIPALEKLVGTVAKVLDWFANLDGDTQTFILTIAGVVAAISPVAGIVSKISGAASSLISVLGGLAAPVVIIGALIAAIAIFGDKIQEVLGKADSFLQNIFAKDFTEVFGPILGEALNGFFANLKNIWDSIKMLFDGIIDFIRGVFTGDWKRAWEGVKEIFGGVFKALVSVAKAPINAIIALINGAINGINKMIAGLNNIHFTIPDWVPLLGGKSFGLNLKSIGNIPYLAKGGILSNGSAIVGEAGPELLTMLGGKAVVQPLTSTTANNYGGVTMNIYGAPGQNVNELADIIMDRMQIVTKRAEAVYR